MIGSQLCFFEISAGPHRSDGLTGQRFGPRTGAQAGALHGGDVWRAGNTPRCLARWIRVIYVMIQGFDGRGSEIIPNL